MPKLELDKFKSFGDGKIRASAHLSQEDAAKLSPKLKRANTSPKRLKAVDEGPTDQASMLKDESIKVPTLFAPAKLKKKIAPKKGVPIGTIGEKSTRRRGISPMMTRDASPVPPPGGARRGRGRAMEVGTSAPLKRSKSVEAEEAESLFQDVRSLLNPVRRPSAVPRRRASMPPKLLDKKPSFRVALNKPRRPSIPTKLPSQVDRDFHIPYLKKVSNNFHGPGKGGPGYGPLKKVPRNNGGLRRAGTKPTSEKGFRLPCLRHMAKKSPLPKGESEGACVTLKRVPRNAPPNVGEGEQLVLLKPVSKKLLPPNQNEKETVILKPWNASSLPPTEEEGDLAILKIRPKGYEAPEKEDEEVVHLKPIPKKYQPENDEVEMVTLKPVPRKSKSATPDSLSNEGDSGFRLPCLRRVATKSSPPKGESVGTSITLKRVLRSTARPKEGEGELVLLKPVPKKLLPPNQNEKETVVLKGIPRNAPLPPEEDGQVAILKTSPKRYTPPEKEEAEIIHLKPIPKKYQPADEKAEMVVLKPISRKLVPIQQEGERVLLKPIPRKAPLPDEKEGEVALLKPLKNKVVRPNGEEEPVVLKPVSRKSPPKDDEEGELVLLRPIPKKRLPPKEEEGEKVVLLKPVPKQYLPQDEPEGEVVTLKPLPPKALLGEMEESEPAPPKEEALPKPAAARAPPVASESHPAPPPGEPAPALVKPALSPSPEEEKPAAAPTPSAAPKAQPAPPPPAAAADKEDDGRVVKDDGTIIVRTADVYMAFNIPDCTAEPSDQEYTKLIKSTTKFFEAHLQKKFPSFQKVTIAKHKTYFGKNIPSAEYNVYVEWDVQAEFHGTSPDRLGLCQNLVKKTNLGKYMSKHLSNLFKTPWKQTDAVFIEQVSDVIMDK